MKVLGGGGILIPETLGDVLCTNDLESLEISLDEFVDDAGSNAYGELASPQGKRKAGRAHKNEDEQRVYLFNEEVDIFCVYIIREVVTKLVRYGGIEFIVSEMNDVPALRMPFAIYSNMLSHHHHYTRVNHVCPMGIASFCIASACNP